MENKKNSAGTIALVVLLLIVTIASLVLATFAWAKYTTTVDNGTAQANVAKWNVTLDANNKSITGTFNHVVSGNIAPGTEGEFDIVIDPTGTEVCFRYDIYLKDLTLEGSGVTAADLNKHIKFFQTRAGDGSSTPYTYSNELVLDDATSKITGTIDCTGTNHNTGNAAHNATTSARTLKVYWVWPYDAADATAKNSTSYNTAITSNSVAYDELDTNIGKGISTMTVKYSTTATQIDPATAIN